MSELKPKDRCTEEQGFDVLLIVASEIVSMMMRANNMDAPTAVRQVVELYSNFGIHHHMIEYLRPETNDMEGDEYASHLDDFENDFIHKLESQWAAQSSASSQEEA